MGLGSRRFNGLPLKEVHLNAVDKAVLDELAEMDVSGLETLEVEVNGERPFPFHLELLSVGSFQSLHKLAINMTWWVQHDPLGFVFTDVNMAFLLSGLPRLTALSLDLIAFVNENCELTTLPFSQSVAENLRKLEVQFRDDWVDEPQTYQFNFRPIGRCKSLEHLSLLGYEIAPRDKYGDYLIEVLTSCDKLASLTLDFRSLGRNFESLMQRIGTVAPASLTTIGINAVVLSARIAPSPMLLEPFLPMSRTLRKLRCVVQTLRNTPSEVFLRCSSLQELSFTWDLRQSHSQRVKFVVDCPSLLRLQLTVGARTILTFAGTHSNLTSVTIRCPPPYYRADEAFCQILQAVESLASLANLTSVAIGSGSLISGDKDGPSLMKLLAGFTSLKRLSFLNHDYWLDGLTELLQAHQGGLDNLLASSSLWEISFPRRHDKAVAGFLERFYAREDGPSKGECSSLTASATQLSSLNGIMLWGCTVSRS
jgi:hypothetical protein